MTSLHYLTARAMSQALATGEVSSLELTRSLLDRIEKLEPKLQAFVTLFADDALDAAEAADRARGAGHGLGPWHGVPVVLKDIVEFAGRRTTGGSATQIDRVSTYTATLAQKLIGAGMIVLGKTHTVEFAMGSFGTNRHMGTPWNPWDAGVHRAPGGSSSGTAVAVAAGLTPWGIGSDTGGSVRIPSSWCGLCGLKTTVGRISCHGVLPLATSLDTPGPLARSVEDAAALYCVLMGPDKLDPETLRHTPDDPFEEIDHGVAGLRLARMPAPERERADPAVLASYDEALETLESLGAHLVDVRTPMSFEQMGNDVGRIIGVEGYATWGDRVDDESAPVDDDVRPRLWPGKHTGAVEYYRIQRERAAARLEFERAMGGVDALLTPTTPTAAPTVDSIDQSGTAAWYTRPANYLNWCALALPSGATRDGLPLSLQIMCRGAHEARALRIGLAYERAENLMVRHPPEFS